MIRKSYVTSRKCRNTVKIQMLSGFKTKPIKQVGWFSNITPPPAKCRRSPCRDIQPVSTTSSVMSPSSSSLTNWAEAELTVCKLKLKSGTWCYRPISPALSQHRYQTELLSDTHRYQVFYLTVQRCISDISLVWPSAKKSHTSKIHIEMNWLPSLVLFWNLGQKISSFWAENLNQSHFSGHRYYSALMKFLLSNQSAWLELTVVSLALAHSIPDRIWIEINDNSK